MTHAPQLMSLSLCGASFLLNVKTPHCASQLKESLFDTMTMGWWRPYFFVELTGVQLLLPGLVLRSYGDCFLGGCFIAVLGYADRWLAHATSRTLRNDNATAALFTAQRLTGGLLMLLMMSFNVPLFLWTVTCVGASERVMLWRRAFERTLLDRAATSHAWSGAEP